MAGVQYLENVCCFPDPLPLGTRLSDLLSTMSCSKQCFFDIAVVFLRCPVFLCSYLPTFLLNPLVYLRLLSNDFTSNEYCWYEPL